MASDSLLGLRVGFNGGLQSGGQLDIAQREHSRRSAALVELGCDLVVNLLGHHFAFAGYRARWRCGRRSLREWRSEEWVRPPRFRSPRQFFEKRREA